MAVKIKCMNEKCVNYKQQLIEGTEICSACNEPVTKIETIVNEKLAMISIVMALVGFVISFAGGWFLPAIVQIIAMLALPASVVTAFISKSKPAAAVSIIALIVSAAYVIYYSFIFA